MTRKIVYIQSAGAGIVAFAFTLLICFVGALIAGIMMMPAQPAQPSTYYYVFHFGPLVKSPLIWAVALIAFVSAFVWRLNRPIKRIL